MAEGSSIFETLFGGFSNGLSIFTNNPFRRKQVQVDAKSLTAVGSDVKKAEIGGDGGEEPGRKQARTVETVTEVSLKEKVNVKRLYDGSGGKDGGGGAEEEIGSTRSRTKRPRHGGAAEKKEGLNAEEDGDNDGRNAPSKGGRASSRLKRKQEASDGAEEPTKVEVGKTRDAHDSQKMKRKKDDDGDLQNMSVVREKKRHREQTSEVRKSESPSVRRSARNKSSKQDAVEEVDQLSNIETIERKSKKIKMASGAPKENTRTETEVAPSESNVEFKKSGFKRKNLDDGKSEAVNTKKQRGFPDSKEEDVAEVTSSPTVKGKRKFSEDEESMGRPIKTLKVREIVDNEAKLKRTIFIGNVSVDVKARHLKGEFSQYGTVESVRLRSVPLVDTKMPRKAAVITGSLNENRSSLNGYLVFKDEISAKAALAHNMKEFKGKHLRVDLAGGSISGIEYDRKRSIFVGNLPFDVEDEELITLFQGSTPDLEVEAVRIVRDSQTSVGKGFAFVCFKTKLGAEGALDKKGLIMLRNRSLRLQRFGSKKPVQSEKRKIDTLKKPRDSKPKVDAISTKTKKGRFQYEGLRAGTNSRKVSHERKLTVKSRNATVSRNVKDHVRPKRPAIAAKKARALNSKNGRS